MRLSLSSRLSHLGHSFLDRMADCCMWLQAARAPFKAAEAKEVERFEAEMLAYNEPVRTTHALCALLFAPRLPSSMTSV